MTPTGQGSFRLFRARGIQVYLHWSWFIVAAYSIQNRSHKYDSLVWPVLEYVALFVIILLHEFGHALACRQTGGKADEIVLWPLGGVAYVSPPERPGAVLWSIAAGPLVNVILLPISVVVWLLARSAGLAETSPNAYHFLINVAFINGGILVFNMLPVYPLDGGQILRSLLWFPLGRARSLKIAAIIGFAGVAGLVILAILDRSIWLGVIAAFVFMNCRRGLLQAGILARVEAAPRRPGFACPACGMAPLAGAFWRCAQCGAQFDTFLTHATCPQCGTNYPNTQCLDCRTGSPFAAWVRPEAK